MKTIQLHKKDVHQGPLILINHHHPLRAGLAEGAGELVSVHPHHEGILLKSRPAVMFSELLKSCDAQADIVPVSGYRTFWEQRQIFADSLRDNGKDFTHKYVALPNCSEHQTGLAIDVAQRKDTIDFICPHFPYDGICRQFRKKAAGFGFVERYQKGKEEITGISPEPWHFRYVGYPHARIMEELNLTLEEYIDFLKEYPYGQNHLKFEENEGIFEVAYVKISGNPVSLELPDKGWYISGNNVDGAILTVGR